MFMAFSFLFQHCTVIIIAPKHLVGQVNPDGGWSEGVKYLAIDSATEYIVSLQCEVYR